MSPDLIAQNKHRYSLITVMDESIIKQVSEAEEEAKAILENARLDALEIIDDAKRHAQGDLEAEVGSAHDKLIRDYHKKERDTKQKLSELEHGIDSHASKIRVELEPGIKNIATKLAKQIAETWRY